MYLEIVKNKEVVNRFDDCLESFTGLLWAYSVKSGTVKKAKFTRYGDIGKVVFTLPDTNGTIDYIYRDIPVSWGLLDTTKLFRG